MTRSCDVLLAETSWLEGVRHACGSRGACGWRAAVLHQQQLEFCVPWATQLQAALSLTLTS